MRSSAAMSGLAVVLVVVLALASSSGVRAQSTGTEIFISSTGTVTLGDSSTGSTSNTTITDPASIEDMELLYPATINGTRQRLCTDTVMDPTQVPSVYEQRTQSPPVCVVFWGRLARDITFNVSGELIVVATARPSFELFKVIFYPQMDTFSLLQVANSQNYFVMKFLTVEIPGLKRAAWVSTAKPVDDGSSAGYVVPFFTLIFQVLEGQPQASTWDDGCFACAESCVSNYFCADRIDTNYQEIGEIMQNANLDLKVYIGWFGTDVNKKYLTSADKRFSQFRKYSINQVYQSAASTVGSLAPSFPPISIDNYNNNGGT